MLSKDEQSLNDKLFAELVPASGKSESLAGELLRAANRIAYRFYNDGDQIGIGYGRRTCNAAARFLLKYGDKEICNFVTTLWGYFNEEAYEKEVDALLVYVNYYILDHPELRDRSTDDMFDYFDEREDKE